MSTDEAMSSFRSAEEWAGQAYSRLSGLTGGDEATTQALADLARSIGALAKGLGQMTTEPPP
ncbi:hypothetical protein [Promicromonospora sp. NPDC057488]|uniref:hypothetical protein n=1 Tax=Promicromonospora sp. NPDC057488 TaxID=3346147 RepID=UPI003670C5AE